MQVTLQNQTKERPQLPPKICKRGDLSVPYKHDCSATSPGRSRPVCSCSNQPGSGQCAHYGYVVPKIPHGNKEVLRRALTPPPARKIGLRWLKFRPTPSRLSTMSKA